MAENNDNTQNGNGNNMAQNVGKAASSVKNAVKAAAKAGAGDIGGAIMEVLKDENFRKAIIAVIMILLFLFTGVFMLVGCVLAATIEAIAQSISENWDEAWEEQSVLSNGNALYMYSLGTYGEVYFDTVTGVASDFYDWVSSLFKNDHVVDGEDRGNTSINGDGTTISDNDYNTILKSTEDLDALAGDDGALMKQINAIQARVKERGTQIVGETLIQYELDSIGKAIALNLSELFQNPILYSGLDIDNSGVNVDTSVFDLSDIQALKIYAAYCVQHDCVISDIDIWDLMDYCGWYSVLDSSLETADVYRESIYNSTAKATFADEIGGAVQEGDIISTDIYEFDPLAVPYWSGTCAPQWYYEELAQIQAHNRPYYEAAIDALQGSSEALDNYQDFVCKIDESGNIVTQNFETLGTTPTFGLIDKLFIATESNMVVSRTEYHGAAEDYKEAVNHLAGELLSQWTDAFGEQSKNTSAGNLVCRDESGNHYYTIFDTDSESRYCLVNQTKGYALEAQLGTDGELTFDGLEGDCTYDVYLLDQNNLQNENSHEKQFDMILLEDTGEDADDNINHIFPSTTLIDTFQTFIDSNMTQAYQLRININIAFQALSVDEMVADLLGLWPDNLEATETIDGVEYAMGYTGNDKLLKNWTDIYTDPDTGITHEMSFTRQQGYQTDAYKDIVYAVADLLGYDTTGLFSPDYGYGSTITSMALAEYSYYTKNNLSGGERYWNIVSEAQYGDAYFLDSSLPWCVTFVNACAYQCGLMDGINAWYDGETWPNWVGGVWTALVEDGLAKGYNSAVNYCPVPGDLILFGSSVGCDNPDHIGIVEYVDENGQVHTIEGNSDNKVQRVTYESYQLGSYAWDGAVISHYIHPNYPASFLTTPLYTTIECGVAPSITALYAQTDSPGVLLFGYPRFRESQMAAVLDELATMYPELYTDALRKAYPHNLGGVRVNGTTWLIPVAYSEVSSLYGWRIHPIYGDMRFHSGIDLSADLGTPIFAPRSGTVVGCGFESTMGNYVKLDHGDGYQTIYMHMTEYAVSWGEEVTAGQVIGYVGSTGDSTGPHLHYSVLRDGIYVDPALYLGLTSPGSSQDSITDSGNDEPADMTALINAWNAVAVSGKAGTFQAAQYDIAEKLYIDPVYQSVVVNTGFNWISTTTRKEILWGIITTSDQQDALTAVMTELANSLNKRISDADLLAAMTSEGYLIGILENHRNELWPADSVEVQDCWINSVQLLLEKMSSSSEGDSAATEPTTP